VNLNAAGCLGVAGLGWVDDGDVLGATTLIVDDIGAGLAAAGPVFAGGAVGHAVVELQVAVELRLDGDTAQRELVDVGTAAKGGRLLLRMAASTADLVSACARREALTAGGTAGPALEVEVVVAREATESQIGEVEARALLGCAVVVRVTGAGERGSISEALRYISIRRSGQGLY
jgi:hypothetical protein